MQLIARTRTGDPAVIRLNSVDNIVIALQALPEGLSLEVNAITVRLPIPSRHKIASQCVEQGQPLSRYGQIIGFASQLIEAGDQLHGIKHLSGLAQTGNQALPERARCVAARCLEERQPTGRTAFCRWQARRP